MVNHANSNLEGPDYCRSVWGVDAKEKFGMSWKINESGLSRIKRHSENGFFIVSAFRSGCEFNVNMDRTDKMAFDVKSAGLGFIQLLGKWVVLNKDTSEEYEVDDISLFVPYKEGFDIKEFFELAKRLAVTYEQEGYIVYSPGSKELYIFDRDKTSKATSFTSKKSVPFAIENLSEYCSNLRKGAQRNYTFEGVRVPSNHISAMCLSNKGHILLA